MLVTIGVITAGYAILEINRNRIVESTRSVLEEIVMYLLLFGVHVCECVRLNAYISACMYVYMNVCEINSSTNIQTDLSNYIHPRTPVPLLCTRIRDTADNILDIE